MSRACERSEAGLLLRSWLVQRERESPLPCIAFLTPAERRLIAAVIGGEGVAIGRGNAENRRDAEEV